MKNRITKNNYKGCLLGGAIGDALGAPIELISLSQIRNLLGEKGLTDYFQVYGREGTITDDTQMLLFTAEGLILSKVRHGYTQDNKIINAIYHALLRWLYTQDIHLKDKLVKKFGTCSIIDGRLIRYQGLFSRRKPGRTCLSALRLGKMGTPENPINDRKGCGGIMRVAPVGLINVNAEKTFRIGSKSAAITHGHPTGYLASGFLAALISKIISGETLKNSINDSILILKKYKKNNECLNAIEIAIEWSEKGAPSAEVVENLGLGWLAEEALSISLYCSLVAENNFRKGILLAVNHSGDSDSTGSITGNILGALHGIKAIPKEWIERLELKNIIEEITEDLFNIVK